METLPHIHLVEESATLKSQSFDWSCAWFSCGWPCINRSSYMRTVDWCGSYAARMETPQESELPVIITTVTCQSKWEVYWVGMLLGYKYILIGCSTVLAMLTKIKKEEFQTRNIIILAYLFAITYGLGIPIYTVLVIIGVHVSVLFTITCVVINTIMYSCLFMLFLPSVIPLIRGKITEVKYIVWQ